MILWNGLKPVPSHLEARRFMLIPIFPSNTPLYKLGLAPTFCHRKLGCKIGIIQAFTNVNIFEAKFQQSLTHRRLIEGRLVECGLFMAVSLLSVWVISRSPILAGGTTSRPGLDDKCTTGPYSVRMKRGVWSRGGPSSLRS